MMSELCERGEEEPFVSMGIQDLWNQSRFETVDFSLAFINLTSPPLLLLLCL